MIKMQKFAAAESLSILGTPHGDRWRDTSSLIWSSSNTQKPLRLTSVNFSRLKPAILIAILSMTFLATLSGCGSSRPMRDALIGRLDDRGPLPISNSNPFLATNVLLGKEMERSQELKGFIELKGLPQALSVRHSLFSTPSISLYYIKKAAPGERYDLEALGDGWLIKGPHAIAENELKQLANVLIDPLAAQSAERELNTAPGQAASFPKQTGRATGFTSPLAGTPTPKAKPTTTSKVATPAPTPRHKATKPPPPAPLPDEQFVQSVLKQAQFSPAELSPKGDLVHYVTYADENLVAIARWYTFDATNAGAIARINGLSSGNHPIAPGDTIVVPAYLIKNKQRLSDVALKSLKSFGSQSAR